MERTIKDYEEDCIIETIYTCKYCGESFDCYDMFAKHQEGCKLNYRLHKNCASCGHYELHKMRPHADNENDYTGTVGSGCGMHNHYYCTFKSKYLKDKDFEDMENKCYDKFTDYCKVVETKEYTDWCNTRLLPALEELELEMVADGTIEEEELSKYK